MIAKKAQTRTRLSQTTIIKKVFNKKSIQKQKLKK